MGRCEQRVGRTYEHNIFKPLSKGKSISPEYKSIPYHFAFDVKFDLRRKEKLVEGEYRTDPPYYIVSGSEFVELKENRLSILGSLFGLQTSAARWHEFLSEKLGKMGFLPSTADLNVRIKDCRRPL